MRRNQFTFYRSFYEGIQCLRRTDRAKVLEALILYALDQVEPTELTSVQLGVFRLIQPVLDTGRRRAEGGIRPRTDQERALLSASAVKRRPSEDAPHLPTSCSSPAQELPTSCSGPAQEVLNSCSSPAPHQLPSCKKEKEKEKENEVETETEACVWESNFQRFWEAYPRKLAREAACQAWRELQPDLNVILPALETWKRFRGWQTEGGRYVPRADRWLREEYWRDPPTEGLGPMTAAQRFLDEDEIAAISRIMQEEPDGAI